MLSHQPAWLNNERYLIEARAPVPNPTKDQMRLMMQALLADRFHFAAHFETHQGPILVLSLAKPGKTGPNLHPHDEGPACGAAPSATTYPPQCDVYSLAMQADKTSLLGSRNTTMDLLANSLPLIGHLGRPVVNRTGLTGRYDFKMNFVMSAPIGPGSGDSAAAADNPGPGIP